MVTIYIRTYDENIKDENDENKKTWLKNTGERREAQLQSKKKVTKNKDITLKIFTKKEKTNERLKELTRAVKVSNRIKKKKLPENVYYQQCRGYWRYWRFLLKINWNECKLKPTTNIDISNIDISNEFM